MLKTVFYHNGTAHNKKALARMAGVKPQSLQQSAYKADIKGINFIFTRKLGRVTFEFNKEMVPEPVTDRPAPVLYPIGPDHVLKLTFGLDGNLLFTQSQKNL
jgi:hypothetical protein